MFAGSSLFHAPNVHEVAKTAHFKKMADKVGMPYQNLINLYLRDRAAQGRKLTMTWAASPTGDGT